jgi:hypothetical protein
LGGQAKPRYKRHDRENGSVFDGHVCVSVSGKLLATEYTTGGSLALLTIPDPIESLGGFVSSFDVNLRRQRQTDRGRGLEYGGA